MSRNQIKKLGARLAASSEISAADDRMLEDLIACHLETLESARPRLDGLAETVGTGPLHVSHRPKTTGTIIEKLRRQGGSMPLHSMQDLAGFRVVGAFSFSDQDRLAAEIARRFPADPREPRIRDRRAEPSYGYRAVHVIVSLDDVTIEVQVRTLGQHLWADLMERLADRLGRQIRYGEPSAPGAGSNPDAARAIVGAMMSLSETWAADEPVIPGHVVNRLEDFTEELWAAFSQAIADAGIDL
jgi:Region found in RelA / SpoT proteins